MIGGAGGGRGKQCQQQQKACCSYRVADPHLLNADPKPAICFNVDSDPNLDPAPLQSDGNLRPLVYRPPRALFWASKPPLLASTALKLLNFDFNADPDPAFNSNADPDPASKNNADPDLQRNFFNYSCSLRYRHIICTGCEPPTLPRFLHAREGR